MFALSNRLLRVCKDFLLEGATRHYEYSSYDTPSPCILRGFELDDTFRGDFPVPVVHSFVSCLNTCDIRCSTPCIPYRRRVSHECRGILPSDGQSLDCCPSDGCKCHKMSWSPDAAVYGVIVFVPVVVVCVLFL